MKNLNAIFDGVLDSLAFISGGLIICMILITSYEIITRYFFGKPLLWGEEVCEYMMFFLSFLSAAWVLKNKGHIEVKILVERLKPRTRTYCKLFASFVGIIISIIILWYSVKISMECYVTGVKIVKTYSQPKWFFLSFIALGYLLLSIEFIRQLLENLRSLGIRKEDASNL